MTPTPQIYLSFNGSCEAAITFYGQRLGATRGQMFPYAIRRLQETFWSLRFGVLTDQFGIPWTLSCSQGPAPTA